MFKHCITTAVLLTALLFMPNIGRAQFRTTPGVIIGNPGSSFNRSFFYFGSPGAAPLYNSPYSYPGYTTNYFPNGYNYAPTYYNTNPYVNGYQSYYPNYAGYAPTVTPNFAGYAPTATPNYAFVAGAAPSTLSATTGAAYASGTSGSSAIAPTAYSEAPANGAALLDVKVPFADAEVWVEGVLMNRLGKTRQYQSPPLKAGDRYAYTIRARWKDEDSRVVDQTRTIAIRAGERVKVDFTQAQSATP